MGVYGGDGASGSENVPVALQQTFDVIVEIDAEALGLDNLHGLDMVDVGQDIHEVGGDDRGRAFIAALAKDEDFGFGIGMHVLVYDGRGAGERGDQLVGTRDVEGMFLNAELIGNVESRLHDVAVGGMALAHGHEESDAFCSQKIAVLDGAHGPEVEERQDLLGVATTLVAPVQEAGGRHVFIVDGG